MKTVRNIVLATSLLLTINYSVAQNLDPAQQATKETEMLTKELQLTPDQEERVSAVVYGIIMKNEGIRKASDLSSAEKERIIQSNAEAKDNMLKSILSDSQFATYQKMKK